MGALGWQVTYVMASGISQLAFNSHRICTLGISVLLPYYASIT